MPHLGFFDMERHLESISRMGDPLERLTTEIPWELFRELLEQVHDKDRKSAAGRKPLDAVLMFKVLILQTLYSLADEAVEYQIRDRLSLMRFLGLEMHHSVPDGTTVWRFRELLNDWDTFWVVLEHPGHAHRARHPSLRPARQRHRDLP